MNQNQPVKLLLDECVGHPVVADINQLLSWDTPTPIISHLFQYFLPGSKDEIWIPKVKDEGWIILTGDKGRNSREKLPQICASYKITHIILSKAIHHQKQHQKAIAIVAVWEQIKDCNNAPKGTRFRLRLNNAGRPVIERVDLPTKT